MDDRVIVVGDIHGALLHRIRNDALNGPDHIGMNIFMRTVRGDPLRVSRRFSMRVQVPSNVLEREVGQLMTRKCLNLGTTLTAVQCGTDA